MMQHVYISYARRKIVIENLYGLGEIGNFLFSKHCVIDDVITLTYFCINTRCCIHIFTILDKKS